MVKAARSSVRRRSKRVAPRAPIAIATHATAVDAVVPAVLAARAAWVDARRCFLTNTLDTPTALVVANAVVVMNVKFTWALSVAPRRLLQWAAPPRLWSDTAWTMVPGALALSHDGQSALTLASTTTPGPPPETNLYRVAIDGATPLIPSVQTSQLSPAWILGNSARVASDAREHVISSPFRNHRCFGAACQNVEILSGDEGPSSIALTPTHYVWTMSGAKGAELPTPGLERDELRWRG